MTRSPGISAKRKVPSLRFTTRDFTMSAGSMPSTAAASSSDDTARRSANSTLRPRAAASAATRSRPAPMSGLLTVTSERIEGMSTLFAPPAPALEIGPLRLDVPVVLAPMAGITNTAFRRLCREYGAGLYVSEMITSRALVERTPESMRLIKHHESETPRSIQLYGVDPTTMAEAVTMLVAEDRADHIDLNFGCPVPKVTRKGGGAALPWKLGLFRSIVEAAVEAAGPVPLTVKMRKGIDADHLTYLEAGRIAEGAGAAAVAPHARTPADFYSGHADWNAISTLKQTVTSIPVLGNGDIWSADDAVRMVEQTGCDGVVVGRGCLGRPWLFGDLAAAFAPSSCSSSEPASWSS